ncbi:MAG: hypothetical protein CMJ83_14680 [Planctomycetes bacterium]|nr:hypothetical protein [Planctomycetota bacterium]
MAVSLLVGFAAFLDRAAGQTGPEGGPARIGFQRGAFASGAMLYGSVLVDRDGFLWLGTTGLGAYRHNGRRGHFFTEGRGGLSGTMVCAMAEDQDGVIWLATLSNGLNAYDKATGRITHHRHDPTDENSLSSDSLTFGPQALCVDRRNRLWVGTSGGGLSCYDKTVNRWTRFRHDPDDANSLAVDTVQAVAADTSGLIWVGTKGGGLHSLDPGSGLWTRHPFDPKDPRRVAGPWITALDVGREAVWIGTHDHGVTRLDLKTGETTDYRHDDTNPESISDDEIWRIDVDSKGRVWVCHPAGNHAGLDMVDEAGGSVVRYSHDPADSHSVSSKSVAAVCEDPDGSALWILNSGGVVDRHDRHSLNFDSIRAGGDPRYSLGAPMVLALVEDPDGVIWIGSTEGGLDRFDPKTRTVRHFLPRRNDETAIPNRRITSLFVDSRGYLWIGSWGGTLSVFDRARGECIRHYRHDSRRASSTLPSCERLKGIVEDKDDESILWIGTVGGGLARLDTRTHTVGCYRHLDDDPNSLSHDSVIGLHDDGGGILWLSTYGGGLNRLDKRTGRFKRFNHRPGDPTSVSSDTQYEVTRDSRGDLWVTSKGGFSRLDERTGSFRNFGRDDGLPSSVICSLLEDDEGSLWMSTINVGLVRFDPKTHEVKSYRQSDGVLGDTFFWISRLKTKGGELWFGGAHGVTHFDPLNIEPDLRAPRIVLTSFTQGGERFDLGSSPERLRKVTLDWRRNHFEFEFAALSFTRPMSNRYAYKLEGWDKEWYQSGDDPSGRYSGLDSGTYRLRIKGANGDGVWNHDGTTIEITVTTPFWRSFAFRGLLVAIALIIAASVAFYVVRLRVEVRRRRIAESALRESEEHLQITLNSIGDAVIVTDVHGVVTTMNPVAAELTAWPVPEAVGRHIEEVFATFAGDALNISLVDVQTTALSIDGDSITSASNSSAAIVSIDLAIDSVTSFRGQLGAAQNRLDTAINSLTVRSENLSAANSRILDVDVAAETAMLTKNSILQQAALSVLAQANQQPLSALSLLGG